MTQAKLAEAVGTTGAVISLLESGDRGLSSKWLLKLAPVLGTKPGHLLEVDPAEQTPDIMEIWLEIPEDRREQALDVLQTFKVKRDPKPLSSEAQQPKTRRRPHTPKGV